MWFVACATDANVTNDDRLSPLFHILDGLDINESFEVTQQLSKNCLGSKTYYWLEICVPNNVLHL